MIGCGAGGSLKSLKKYLRFDECLLLNETSHIRIRFSEKEKYVSFNSSDVFPYRHQTKGKARNNVVLVSCKCVFNISA